MVRTVVMDKPGGADVLHIGDYPIAELSPHDVRIRVKAAGINRAELLQRAGQYPLPPGTTPILGLEAAGTIIEVGSAVQRWKGGEKVMALSNGGAYSEQLVVPGEHVLNLPDGWSWEEGAGFMETAVTSFLNIFQEGGYKNERTGELKQGAILVHGGGSGIGTSAIKLAKAKGIKIFVTAGSDEKVQQCKALGADHAINYRTEKYEEVVLRHTDDRGVDVILDNVGGSYLPRDVSCLALDGRVVLIGLMGGREVEKLDLGRVMAKRLSIIGSALRSRSKEFKSKLIADLEEQYGADIESGSLKPVIYKTFPLEQAAEAHKTMESNAHFGKVILVT